MAEQETGGTTKCPICRRDIGGHTHEPTVIESWRWSELASDEEILEQIGCFEASSEVDRASIAGREVMRRLRMLRGDLSRMAVDSVRMAAELRLYRERKR